MFRQEQMFAHIDAYELGNDSIPAYCGAHDLKVPSFHYWRRKLRDAHSAMPAFIPVLPPVADPAIAVRLAYPNGVSVHLSALDLPLIA